MVDAPLYLCQKPSSDNEQELRARLVKEAYSWVKTPYLHGCAIKGVGANCAMLMFGIAKGAGILATEVPTPKHFTAQAALHSKDERLLRYLLAYGFTETDEDHAKPGDILLYKNGLAHGHMAMMVTKTAVVHTLSPVGCKVNGFADGVLGTYSRRYFTLWRG